MYNILACLATLLMMGTTNCWCIKLSCFTPLTCCLTWRTHEMGRKVFGLCTKTETALFNPNFYFMYIHLQQSQRLEQLFWNDLLNQWMRHLTSFKILLWWHTQVNALNAFLKHTAFLSLPWFWHILCIFSKHFEKSRTVVVCQSILECSL